jgi:L-fucose mutarotase
MLKYQLLHPEILHALAANGHGARILIADGNFPVSTQPPAACKKVFLNLAPGLLSVTDVLKALLTAIPVESAIIMTPPDAASQPVHAEFKEIIGENISIQPLTRFDFYNAAGSPDVCLAIATGETRRFANILLTIGVVK